MIASILWVLAYQRCGVAAEFDCLYSEVFLTRNAWEKRKLGETNSYFTDGNYGESYPKESELSDKENGVPFLRGSNLRNGELIEDNANYITKEKHAELTSGHLVEDDIVLAVRGSLGALGYVKDENIDWNINSQLAVIRTDKSELSGKFLVQFLLSWRGQKELLSRNTGTALKQLPIKQLKDVPVPIVNLDEQKEIGALFSSIDNLIAATQHKIDAWEQAKKALLQRLFDQSWRFKGYSDPWEKRKLTELSKNKIGGGTPSTKVLDFWNGKLPWLQSSDINESNNYSVKPQKFISLQALKHSAAKRVPANSIAVVTRVGVGKLALIEYDYSTSQDFLSFSSLNWSALFSVNLLTLIMTQMSRESQGTSIKGVTKSELLAKKVRIPISLKEQEKLGILMKSINDLIAATQSRFSSLELLKKALLQDLFI